MTIQRFFLLLFAALLLSVSGACADTTDEIDGLDGEFERGFLADGKADGSVSDCEADAILGLLNDPDTTADDLRERGVHTRAARALINHRNGEDGIPGTEDDRLFGSLEDVDNVRWVGPVAARELRGAVAQSCVIVQGLAEVIFSPQPYNESHNVRVAELIDGAQYSIDIAMYSFSDAGIRQALERAIERGVSIRMLFHPASSHRRSPNGTFSATLERIGIDVRYINRIMHHKFAIIDGPRTLVDPAMTDQAILINGSGNWSNGAATRYDENTLFIYGNARLNLLFQQEFNHLWEYSRDFEFVSYDKLYSESIEDRDIPADPVADAVFTSPNFDIFTNHLGPGFTTVRGRDTVANRIVELIEEAEESIYVASGHFRSRPVAEALLRKHEENPQMDIRIYIDAQDYVSYSAHLTEKRNQESCLESANTETQRQACLDRAYRYTWDAKEAGMNLRYKKYAYRWHFSYALQMHHKYFIIDGKTLITGSYNLSDNAEHNTMENMVILTRDGYANILDEFLVNFEEIWDTGEGLYGEFLAHVESGEGDFPLVFAPMSVTHDEFEALRLAILRNCPLVTTQEYNAAPERFHTCER